MHITGPKPQNDMEEPLIVNSSPDPVIHKPDPFYIDRVLTRHVVPAGHGFAFAARQGTRFRIVDLHGEQIVDLMAWAPAPDSGLTGSTCGPLIQTSLEKMSPAYTRYHLRGVTPNIGEALWSTADRPILCVTADTVKVHDMTYMACFPALYEKLGHRKHRSCAQNIFEAMQLYGMKDILEVPEPFNCFQNTPNYSLKAMGSSKPGDYIEFEVMPEEGLIIAVSSCPYDVEDFVDVVITDIAVIVSEEKEEYIHF